MTGKACSLDVISEVCESNSSQVNPSKISTSQNKFKSIKLSSTQLCELDQNLKGQRKSLGYRSIMIQNKQRKSFVVDKSLQKQETFEDQSN